MSLHSTRSSLACAAREFMARYGTPALMGRHWQDHLKGIDPGQRFERLLTLTGCHKDADRFFAGIRAQIQEACSLGRSARVVLNGIELPKLFLYSILEAENPGQHLLTVNRTQKLTSATGFPVQDHETMQAVLDQYPVRLSRHVIRQSLVSEAVAAQYLPFAEELGAEGHTLTFDGHFKQGLMEQMYRNRAIFLLDMRCPVYCRFCFRKHKSLRRETCPAPSDVAAAVAKVGANPEIQEILITGGEPLLNLPNLEAALAGLMELSHIRTMRIATRSLAYYPHLFVHRNRRLIRRLKAFQQAAWERGKALEIGVHMVHPDEVSVQTLDIIADLTASGIPVYVQTPYLKGINDDGRVLGRLFALLRHAGAEIYYIFTPCHPIHGTQRYWSPISSSLAAYARVRACVSDRAIPKLCTATPLGKMEWHTSGWAVEADRQDPDHIWIRTPYTREYFEPMVQSGAQFPEVRDNPGGTLDAKCLIDMGDDQLFKGSFRPGAAAEPAPVDPAVAEQVIEACYTSERLTADGCHQPCPGLFRVHRTRVELRPCLKRAALDYLAGQPEITDIVVQAAGFHIDTHLDNLSELMQALDEARFHDRPFTVRIRWQAFYDRPGQVTAAHIERIVRLSDLSFTRPRRVEIETWWLLPDQVTPAHELLGRTLLSKGIPVYANMPVLKGVNDGPDLVVRMAHALRSARMDFHHVYVSGLLVHNRFPRPEDYQVLSIASHVRKVCSGRQIPLYVHNTCDGERDFGLSGEDVFQAPGLSR